MIEITVVWFFFYAWYGLVYWRGGGGWMIISRFLLYVFVNLWKPWHYVYIMEIMLKSWITYHCQKTYWFFLKFWLHLVYLYHWTKLAKNIHKLIIFWVEMNVVLDVLVTTNHHHLHYKHHYHHHHHHSRHPLLYHHHLQYNHNHLIWLIPH